MPRKKSLSLAERIAAAEAELEALTQQMKEKKQELKALKAEQKEADRAKLIEAFIASGKTVDEVIALLNTK